MNDHADNIDRIVALIHSLYAGDWASEREPEVCGGMLHVQLDDGNLLDCDFKDPFKPYLIELFGRQPLDIERQIVALMRVISEDDREEVYERFWREYFGKQKENT